MISHASITHSLPLFFLNDHQIIDYQSTRDSLSAFYGGTRLMRVDQIFDSWGCQMLPFQLGCKTDQPSSVQILCIGQHARKLGETIRDGSVHAHLHRHLHNPSFTIAERLTGESYRRGKLKIINRPRRWLLVRLHVLSLGIHCG